MTWYNDIKLLVADASLKLLPLFRIYSNLRRVSADLSGINSNSTHQPFLAAWHPTTAIIVLGKQIKNKNDQLTSIRHYTLINHTTTYIKAVQCDRCHLASDQYSRRKGCIIDFYAQNLH
jgi:hypothetical protein